jgi:hypothetical protein
LPQTVRRGSTLFRREAAAQRFQSLLDRPLKSRLDSPALDFVESTVGLQGHFVPKGAQGVLDRGRIVPTEAAPDASLVGSPEVAKPSDQAIDSDLERGLLRSGGLPVAQLEQLAVGVLHGRSTVAE